MDLGDHVGRRRPDGVKLRRIKLTQSHLHDMSRMSSGASSRRRSRAMSAIHALGRSRGDSSVINIRM